MPKSPIPGANVLLMGSTGTGKTYSLRTLVEAGITPFVIFTEPGMEVLGDLKPGSYHYHYIRPTTSDWSALRKTIDLVNKLDFNSLTKVQDANRTKYNQLLELIDTCNDFKCDLTGKQFGDVSTWGTDRALVIDSLTGLNQMAMQLVVGGRVTRSMPDWMIAQNSLKMLLDKLTTTTHCWFVVCAHVERETDEVTGGTTLMVSTLGRKLAPQIPLFFSDVIQTVRNGTEFTWNTAGSNIDVKARNLPIQAKLEPSFLPLVERWKSNGGIIESSSEAAA